MFKLMDKKVFFSYTLLSGGLQVLWQKVKTPIYRKFNWSENCLDCFSPFQILTPTTGDVMGDLRVHEEASCAEVFGED